MKDSRFIGQLSRKLGISTNTIRYYERLGLIPQPYRAHNTYRVYAKEHEEHLIFIQKAKRFGLSLNEIKTLVDIRAIGEMPCEEAKRLIRMHLEDLNTRIQKMIVFRDELAERSQQLESVGAASGAVCGLIEREDS
ncbi:MAG: MerR family transcriptional regulator [Chloroflexi bacterium]|nr:MerR family transcriptional regulator [Chloroflexota bacterium]